MAASDTANDSYKLDIERFSVEVDKEIDELFSDINKTVTDFGQRTAKGVGEAVGATIAEIEENKDNSDDQIAQLVKKLAAKAKADIDTNLNECGKVIVEKGKEGIAKVKQMEKENKISPSLATELLNSIKDVIKHAFTKMKEFAANACGMFAETVKGGLDFILGAIKGPAVFVILLPLLIVVGLLTVGATVVGLVFTLVGGVIVIAAAAVTCAAALLVDVGLSLIDIGGVALKEALKCVLKLDKEQ